MKKFIITSACTLGLTLLGTFGMNQNPVDTSNGLNINDISTKVVESVKETQKQEDKAGQESKSSTSNTDKKTVTDKNGDKKVVTTKPSSSKKATAKATPTPSKKATATATPTPSKKPAATSKPSTSANTDQSSNTSDLNAYAKEVLQIVNQERAKAGLPALTTNSTLQSAANKRAQEIAKSFSHTRPDGSSFYTVLKEYGVSYRSAGENIAYGQKSPQAVMEGWMNSSGHRANILNKNFGKVGIGVYKVNGVLYWTQVFTN